MIKNEFFSYISGGVNHAKLYPRAWELVLDKFKNLKYAESFGIRTPKIFWSGDYTTIPWKQLPNTYIIKPVSGSSSRGVFVVKDGIDISTNQPINKLEVYHTLKKNADNKKELLGESLNNRNICFISELIGNNFADDYKFYVFNGKVKAIRYNQKITEQQKKSTYYNEKWENITNISTKETKFYKSQPKNLKLMIKYSEKIAKDLNVPFIRVDFYLDNEEPIFGELCMTPNGGNSYTDYALIMFNSFFSNTEKISFKKLNQINEKYDCSIIIPTYNNVEFIEETIESIKLSGKNHKFEVLIGIDGCKPTLEYVLNNEYPPNINFYFFNENGGPYTIKNTLVNFTNSNNIIFFDSDDVMKEEFIPYVLNNIKSCDYISLKYFNFSETQNRKYTVYKTYQQYAMGSFVIKKDLFLSMNGFEPWVCAADHEFLVRIQRMNKKILYSRNVLFLRRLHQNNLTKRKDTGMRSTLRAHYWRLTNNKVGVQHPKQLNIRDFNQIENVSLEKIKQQQINFLNKKIETGALISNILETRVIEITPNKEKKQEYKSIDYDVVNKLFEKKTKGLNITNKNIPLNRQELFDLKRKKN
jgi:glycosyltransferase involved in cell wall biosynthesis/glutathione synthase/RimK-type ligase-like ATP-grasp enzyme